MPGAANLIVEARAAVLDAVEALSAHRESVILVGAQAVYLPGLNQLARRQLPRTLRLGSARAPAG